VLVSSEALTTVLSHLTCLQSLMMRDNSQLTDDVLLALSQHSKQLRSPPVCLSVCLSLCSAGAMR